MPNQLALVVDDANPRPKVGDVAAYGSGRTDFADVENRVMAIGHAEATRAVQVLPLGLELTVAVEDLHPVVLTVGYVDPTIGVTADVVDDIELAFTGAGLTPRHQQLSVRRVFVDAGVAVAVRDVNVASRRQRGVSAAMERLAAHVGRRLARHAEFQQHLAVEHDLAHEMPAIVGEEHRVIRRHVDAVRPRVLALSP